MGRAIAADGFGTALASSVGGSPTTTYAENIGVMAATRVYSTAAYYVAAVVAILFGLSPKFGALVSSTPGGVLGGITVVLYGMIGLLGAKIWKENNVDFGNPLNLVPLAAGIIIAIGDRSLEITDDFILERHRPGHDRGHRLLPPGTGDRAGRHARSAEPGTMLAVGEPGMYKVEDEPVPTAETLTSNADRSHRSSRKASPPVKPAPFAYHRPATLDEAVETLAATGGKVLAGGQSLVPIMSMRLAARRRWSTSTTIPGQDVIRSTTAASRIGALDAAPLRSSWTRRRTPRTRCCDGRCSHVAHPTIRNRGTTVGSLVHADPAAEMPAVLALLGGSVEATELRRGARRTIAAADFFVGPLESALEPDEIAVSRDLPASARRGSGTAWLELARRHGDYAMVGVGALVDRPSDAGAVVERRSVALISVGLTPVVVE